MLRSALVALAPGLGFGLAFALAVVLASTMSCDRAPSDVDGDQAAMDLALDAAELPGEPAAPLDAAELPGEPAAPITRNAPEGDEAAPPPGPVEPTEPTAAPAPPPPPPDSFTENLTETLDCPQGGTVRVVVRRDRTEAPYARKGHITWTYEACALFDYGTIDGRASYGREQHDADMWTRKLSYHADLIYTGTATGKCHAYVTITQEWPTSAHRLEAGSTCPHPVRQWWDRIGF